MPEAPLEQTEHGRVAAGEGWFVLNARDARWRHREGKATLPFEGEADFPQLGINLIVLAPGEPMAMYHWETDQEEFLVLWGEALLIVEGQERPLRRWDFVHCPPRTQHVIVGAGTEPCVVVAVGAREHQTTRGPDGTLEWVTDWGAYTVDEAALRHGAGVEEETADEEVAYARFPDSEPSGISRGLASGLALGLGAGGDQPRPEPRERDLVVDDVLDLRTGDREDPFPELRARMVVPLGDFAARPEREPDGLRLARE